MNLNIFFRFVEVASYLPGRVRLRSRLLVGNKALEKKIKEYLSAFKEIESVETNTLTGSVLVKYIPEILAKNKKLRKAEKYIIARIGRK